MDAFRWDERPTLHRPVLVAAFEGWNDAADAASTAARYLAASWEARDFARIDPEEFYDFTVARPEVRLVDGTTRSIEWPEPTFATARVPGTDRDVVFLQAVEPQLRWRTYVDTIVQAARTLGVELAITLGALLAEVPHTRPVRVTGTAGSPELARLLDLQRSRYEGPTGIVGVLHDALQHAGVPSASLWATVPHYVGKTPSPKATLALVRRAGELLQTRLEAVDLEVAAAAYERQVSEVVAEDEDVSAYVRRLEEEDDEGDDDEGDDDEARPDRSPFGLAADLPSGDALATEAERFLRDQGDGP